MPQATQSKSLQIQDLYVGNINPVKLMEKLRYRFPEPSAFTIRVRKPKNDLIWRVTDLMACQVVHNVYCIQAPQKLSDVSHCVYIALRI